MELNVLFWNVQKKDLTTQIVNIAHSRSVDILILAENPVSTVRLVQALNTTGPYYFSNHPLSQCFKLTIITRFDHHFIPPVDESDRVTIRHVRLSTSVDFLLTGVHLVDKRSHSADSQNEAATLVADQLRKAEERLGVNRHVVIGDFNMNPFETGMIKANGFHATMSSEVARKGARTVQKQNFPYFYNPTWTLFGDLNKLAAGTYYYAHAEHVCYEWNVFDQVLIRPALLDNFVKDSLQILETDGSVSLLTRRNMPDKAKYSDHLPLFFTLSF
ncbi:endonuclease/exonuclease/phosphatase family protein [Spirosoma oryzae]|nr:endonuclease/exonuclease/phosphatase family protein [Spirosoma oryzae]